MKHWKSELVVKVRMMKKEIHIFMKSQLHCIFRVAFWLVNAIQYSLTL